MNKYIDVFLFFIVLILLVAIIFGSVLSIQQQSPEERRDTAYYQCVRIQAVNGRDVGTCNQIK